MPTPANPPKLLDQVQSVLRTKHYSIRTERVYLDWIKRYILFHHKTHPAQMGAAEVEAFLSHLAVAGKVAASTQNQAKSALLFLYREVLALELPWLDNVTQAKIPQRLPVVLTVSEVKSVLNRLDGTLWLMASLLYGGGLRLMECVRLRVKDVDFEMRQMTVREGKGFKDRVTMLPESFDCAFASASGAGAGRCMMRTWRRAMARSICLMRWRKNTPTRRRNGAGSMCFRRAACRSIRVPA